MQVNTRRFTVAPLPKIRHKVQSVHQHWITEPNITARDLHRLLGMLMFMASLVRRRRLRLCPVPVVGCHSMVPEDRELVRPDPSSSVGSVRGGLVGISSSPARSIPRRQGDGSDSLHGCVQFGLGSPVRLTLDTGTVVSISMIIAHQRSGDAGRHLCRERLPASSEVLGGLLDVRQRSDCGLHKKNEGGTRSHTLMQLTIRLLQWCDRKAITLVPVHLPGVHNVQADSLSRVGQTLIIEWTRAMERLRPVFAKWGEPQVDLFVTFANRLIKFISPYPDPRAVWTDAMSMPWENGRGLLYVFPPFKIVPQVLQKIAQSPGVRMILIAQLQLAALWFRN